MKMMDPDAIQTFAGEWLPAWTGNRPELLASFYSEDALYIDPAVPQGVRGRAALLEYFGRLLGYNPRWVWTQIEGIPMSGGFLNKWKAAIPVGEETLDIVGVCLVQMDSRGKIQRNEVYFDRSELLGRIADCRAVARGTTRGQTAAGDTT